MTGRADGKTARQPSSSWARLASVARERACEQSGKALAASDTEAAGLHREQEAYFVRLAEVYEGRARDGVTAT